MKFAQFPRSRSGSTLRLTIASVWPLACLLSSPLTLIASEPLAKGIQDNSFFIDEAYNQEPDVVQHIFNLPIDFTNMFFYWSFEHVFIRTRARPTQ